MSKPTLILPPRYTDDSNKMWKAAIDLGWEVERINWLIPPGFAPAKPVIYGEPLFNQFVADQLGVTLSSPWPDFLQCIDEKYTKRRIGYLSAKETRLLEGPIFLKPPNNKTFPAGVYNSGLNLPDFVQDSEIVLWSEPVFWLSEFRFFIYDRKIKTHSIYSYKGIRTYKDNPYPNIDKQESLCINSLRNY